MQAALDDIARRPRRARRRHRGSGPAFSGGHDLKEMMANRNEAFIGDAVRALQPRDADDAGAAAAGDRARARRRDRGRLPARRRVRPRGRVERRALRDVGHQLRAVLRDAGRAGLAQRLAQARVRDAVHRRVHRRRDRAGLGTRQQRRRRRRSSTRACAADRRRSSRSRAASSRPARRCSTSRSRRGSRRRTASRARRSRATCWATTPPRASARSSRSASRAGKTDVRIGNGRRRSLPCARNVAPPGMNPRRALPTRPASPIISAHAAEKRCGAATCASTAWPTTSFSRRAELTKEFKGFVAVKRRRPDGPPRHDPRADRAERRRQDDLLQPAHAFPDADARADLLQRPRDHRLAPGRHRAHGPGALVPDLGGVPAAHGAARTCASRCSAQRGHSFDFWRSESMLAALDDARADELIDAVGLAGFENHGGRRAPVRPQARARDRDHARARAGDDAARRADRGHGARGRRRASPR